MDFQTTCPTLRTGDLRGQLFDEGVFDDAPFGTGLLNVLATAIGAGETTGPDELARLFEDLRHTALHHRRRHRLGQEFRDPGIARLMHTGDLGVTGQHDDRHEGVRAVLAGTDDAGQVETVQRLHPPVGDHDVGGEFIQDPERGGAIGGLRDLLHAEREQDGPDEVPHQSVVVHDKDAQVLQVIGLHWLRSAFAPPARSLDVTVAAGHRGETLQKPYKIWGSLGRCRLPLPLDEQII